MALPGLKRKWNWADSLRQATSITALPDDWPSPPPRSHPQRDPQLRAEFRLPSTVSPLSKRPKWSSDEGSYLPQPHGSVPSSAAVPDFMNNGVPGAARVSESPHPPADSGGDGARLASRETPSRLIRGATSSDAGPRGRTTAAAAAAHGAATAAAAASGGKQILRTAATAPSHGAATAGETGDAADQATLGKGTETGTARGGRLGAGTAAPESRMGAVTLLVHMVLAQLSVSQRRQEATPATNATMATAPTTPCGGFPNAATCGDSVTVKRCRVNLPPQIPAAIAATGTTTSTTIAENPPPNAGLEAGANGAAARGHAARGTPPVARPLVVPALPPVAASPLGSASAAASPPATSAQNRTVQGSPFLAAGSCGAAPSGEHRTAANPKLSGAQFPPTHTATASRPAVPDAPATTTHELAAASNRAPAFLPPLAAGKRTVSVPASLLGKVQVLTALLRARGLEEKNAVALAILVASSGATAVAAVAAAGAGAAAATGAGAAAAAAASSNKWTCLPPLAPRGSSTRGDAPSPVRQGHQGKPQQLPQQKQQQQGQQPRLLQQQRQYCLTTRVPQPQFHHKRKQAEEWQHVHQLDVKQQQQQQQHCTQQNKVPHNRLQQHELQQPPQTPPQRGLLQRPTNLPRPRHPHPKPRPQLRQQHQEQQQHAGVSPPGTPPSAVAAKSEHPCMHSPCSSSSTSPTYRARGGSCSNGKWVVRLSRKGKTSSGGSASQARRVRRLGNAACTAAAGGGNPGKETVEGRVRQTCAPAATKEPAAAVPGSVAATASPPAAANATAAAPSVAAPAASSPLLLLANALPPPDLELCHHEPNQFEQNQAAGAATQKQGQQGQRQKRMRMGGGTHEDETTEIDEGGGEMRRRVEGGLGMGMGMGVGVVEEVSGESSSALSSLALVVEAMSSASEKGE
ncbi:hypothetical protein CLOM_g8198 [Closterium sp. NIES-68]|nr:hypothetical protein CLOM_g8198 [Closterium sp. NIES-68]GJP84760.1 hypothetical protein CLOP_g14815 [Closterium sp. NIES-67]